MHMAHVVNIDAKSNGIEIGLTKNKKKRMMMKSLKPAKKVAASKMPRLRIESGGWSQ